MPVAPKVLRKTISGATAAELTGIMEAVVERGTAKAAQIPGYTIAGKTGTAAKLVGGRYSRSEYNASFVGFMPSRNPSLAIIVVIDSPHAKGYYGGTVAAPVFQRIAEASLRHLGIPPNINALPPVFAARHDEPADSVRPRPIGDPGVVESVVAPPQPGIMPDLRGQSAREALRTLTSLGAAARLVGSGFVIEQSPEAGAPLADGELGVLKLGRRMPAAPPGSGTQ